MWNLALRSFINFQFSKVIDFLASLLALTSWQAIMALCIRRTRTRTRTADACKVARVSCYVALFRVMLHVFPVTLQETRATLQETPATLHASASGSASAEYTKPLLFGQRTCIVLLRTVIISMSHIPLWFELHSFETWYYIIHLMLTKTSGS